MLRPAQEIRIIDLEQAIEAIMERYFNSGEINEVLQEKMQNRIHEYENAILAIDPTYYDNEANQ